MKILVAVAFLSLSLLFSCGEVEKKVENLKDSAKAIIKDVENKVDSTVKEVKSDTAKVAVAKYICPAGCEGSESDKPGTCKSCEMDLIENPNFK